MQSPQIWGISFRVPRVQNGARKFARSWVEEGKSEAVCFWKGRVPLGRAWAAAVSPHQNMAPGLAGQSVCLSVCLWEQVGNARAGVQPRCLGCCG